jgi:uncharacterized DUF497 family protein
MNDEHEFEWDAGKAEANVRKHGIAFEAARRVFQDGLPLNGPMQTCPTVKRGLSSQAWSTAGC